MSGAVHVKNKHAGQKTLNPGANQGNIAFTQPFIYGFAQVENVIVNEDNSVESMKSRTSELDAVGAAKIAGRVQVRLLPTYRTTPRKQLPWADPLLPHQSHFPIIGEYVLVFKASELGGKYFYIGPVTISRSIQSNSTSLLGDIIEDLKNAAKQTVAQFASYGAASLANTQTTTQKNEKLVNFNPPSDVQPLKAFEGDVIFQGRYGNSIRLGSSQMNQSDGKDTKRTQYPNIILRAGQSKKSLKTSITPDGLTIEDIQNDASSIYLTSNQVVPFIPSTRKDNVFLKSVAERPASFAGAQIILNSDTLILNSKAESIFLFSNKGIHLNSLAKGITLDTSGEIRAFSNTDVSLIAKQTLNLTSDGNNSALSKSDVDIASGRELTIRAGGQGIHLGGYSGEEPLVLAYKLSAFLLEFINCFVQNPNWTMGPTGIYNPALMARLMSLWATHAVLPTGIPMFAARGVFASAIGEAPGPIK